MGDLNFVVKKFLHAYMTLRNMKNIFNKPNEISSDNILGPFKSLHNGSIEY